MPAQPRSTLQSIVGTLQGPLSSPPPVEEASSSTPLEIYGTCLVAFHPTRVQDAHKVRQAACFVWKAQWTSLDSPCAFPAPWNSGVGNELLSCYPFLPKYVMRSKWYSYLILLSKPCIYYAPQSSINQRWCTGFFLNVWSEYMFMENKKGTKVLLWTSRPFLLPSRLLQMTLHSNYPFPIHCIPAPNFFLSHITQQLSGFFCPPVLLGKCQSAATNL